MSASKMDNFFGKGLFKKKKNSIKLKMKAFNVLVVLYLITVLNEKNRVEAFSFYDLFKLPLGYLTEKLFNWNPFRTQVKENTYLRTQLDEFSLIDPNNDYINGTIERKHFPYGCKCTDYSCNCCAHIEINKLNLNDTGLILFFFYFFILFFQ